MLVILIKLLSVDEVRMQIKDIDIKYLTEVLENLFLFFDSLDCHDSHTLTDINHLVGFGNEEPDPDN